MTSSSADPRIVVGVDGSESSSEALLWAKRLSNALGVGIEALMFWDYPPAYGWAPAFPPEYRPDQDAALTLAEAITSALGEPKPEGIKESVRQGHPSQLLVTASKGAEMLVVGSRGHGGFTGLLLGSVSAHCAEHAMCPVLVVHPTTHGGKF
ncbi:universal stress protein [Williamsia sp.]|uniref:universal stress protein n=1 Tax=Williamsia sp. TaxID=1872085 RepID=UPI002F91E573